MTLELDTDRPVPSDHYTFQLNRAIVPDAPGDPDRGFRCRPRSASWWRIAMVRKSMYGGRGSAYTIVSRRCEERR